MFSDQQLSRIEELKKRYQHPRSVVLEALWMWQDEHGWISEEGMKAVADALGIPPHDVFGVVSFYTMFNRKPVGRHKIEVCTNVSCNLCGADDVLDAFLRYTDTELGETSEDGNFTVVEAECLAACGFPTCVQINSRYYENVSTAEVPKIVEHLRAEAEGR